MEVAFMTTPLPPPAVRGDLFRALISLDEPVDAQRVVLILARDGRVVDDRDFFRTPRPDGYRARHVHVELPSPPEVVAGEVQITVPTIAEIQAEVVRQRLDSGFLVNL